METSVVEKKESWGARARFYAAIALLDLIILELVAGVFFPYNRPSTPRKSDVYVVSSPTRVNQFVPNARFVYDGAEYSTNSLGFRDREFAVEKPANTVRVAIFGDSYIEGYGEKQEDTIPKAMERELQEKLGRPVEVINGGVRGGSPAVYEFWVKALMPYSPDAVVICVSDSDLGDDTYALLTKAFYRARAWYELPEWLRRSNIVSYVHGEWANLKFKLRRKQISRELYGVDDFDQGKAGQADNDRVANAKNLFAEPEKWTGHWRRTQGNLERIVDFLGRQGVGVVVVFVPSNHVVPEKPVNVAPEKMAASGFLRDPIADWMAEWAGAAKIPFVNLCAEVQEWYRHPSRTPLFRPQTGHFDPYGGVWVAAKINSELLKTLKQ